MLARDEVDPPNVSGGGGDDLYRLFISGEVLAGSGTCVRRRAAVHCYRIGLSVLVAVIVFKQDARLRSRQYPRPRPVFTDKERYPDAILFAGANMHHHRLILEARIVAGIGRDRAGKSLSANFLKLLPEGIDARRRSLGGCPVCEDSGGCDPENDLVDLNIQIFCLSPGLFPKAYDHSTAALLAGLAVLFLVFEETLYNKEFYDRACVAALEPVG